MGIAASKKIACFALIAFLAVAFFGMSHAMGIEKQNDGKMGGCIFFSKAEICTMSFGEHLTQWKSMLATIAPQKELASASLLLLVVVFAAVAILKRNLLFLSSYYAMRWRLYIRQNPHLSLFNPLKEAFARGILNPKIY